MNESRVTTFLFWHDHKCSVTPRRVRIPVLTHLADGWLDKPRPLCPETLLELRMLGASWAGTAAERIAELEAKLAEVEHAGARRDSERFDRSEIIQDQYERGVYDPDRAR